MHVIDPGYVEEILECLSKKHSINCVSYVDGEVCLGFVTGLNYEDFSILFQQEMSNLVMETKDFDAKRVYILLQVKFLANCGVVIKDGKTIIYNTKYCIDTPDKSWGA